MKNILVVLSMLAYVWVLFIIFTFGPSVTHVFGKIGSVEFTEMYWWSFPYMLTVVVVFGYITIMAINFIDRKFKNE